MKEKFKKVIAHIKENKEIYILGAITLAGFTYLIVRDHSLNSVNDASGDTLARIKTPLATPGFNNSGSIESSAIVMGDSNDIIVNVLPRDGRGHPGYLVKNIENGLTYPSQIAAAIEFDINPAKLSKHLNGQLADASGYHFERIQMAA